MKVGTKSLLFGVHCWFIHPLFVWLAWVRIYGFPWDPRLYVCFLVHDWGYWGASDMDGFDGMQHPFLGGAIADRLMGPAFGDLVRYHSRHYSKFMGKDPSKLCAPDKLASALYPEWLYLFLGNLSGEIHEYVSEDNCRVLRAKTGVDVVDQRTWFRALCLYLEQESRRTAAD